jgi:cobaltochelatase CobN
MESVERGLWQQPDEAQLERMRQVYLELEGDLEDQMDTPRSSRHPAEGNAS